MCAMHNSSEHKLPLFAQTTYAEGFNIPTNQGQWVSCASITAAHTTRTLMSWPVFQFAVINTANTQVNCKSTQYLKAYVMGYQNL